MSRWRSLFHIWVGLSGKCHSCFFVNNGNDTESRLILFGTLLRIIRWFIIHVIRPPHTFTFAWEDQVDRSAVTRSDLFLGQFWFWWSNTFLKTKVSWKFSTMDVLTSNESSGTGLGHGVMAWWNQSGTLSKRSGLRRADFLGELEEA